MSFSDVGDEGNEVEDDFITSVYEESLEDPPEDQWSSLICMQGMPTINEKRELYEQGLYDPGSDEICLKYDEVSSSTIYRHPYYLYPALEDPGIDECLFDPIEKNYYPDDGQKLYLDICKEMDQCVVSLFYNSLLQNKIDLKYYCVRPSGIHPMVMALMSNPYVKVLDLSDSFLDLDACFHLGDLLISNQVLEELILIGCRVGAAGVFRLIAGRSRIRKLKLLNLDRNELGDVGLEHLNEAYTEQLTIPKISLSCNKITSRGINNLSHALEFNNKLTHVDLSWNNFAAPLGICNLLNRFSESGTLVELNLSWCFLIGPRVGSAINSVLKSPQLTYLNLSNNKLADEAIISIAKGIGNASKLLFLDLSSNPMSTTDSLLILTKLQLKKVKIQKLFMDHVYVSNDFIVLLDKIKTMKIRKGVIVTYGDVVVPFIGKGPDKRELIMNRLEYLCKSRKHNKVDIALEIMQLAKDNIKILAVDALLQTLKRKQVPVEANIIEELANIFPGPAARKAKTVDLLQVLDYVHRKWPDRKWPDRKLPPTPPPELELPPPTKGKGKGKGKK